MTRHVRRATPADVRRAYKRTWYWKITLPSMKSPDNWIIGTPIKLFGRMILIKWKIPLLY